MTRRFRITRFRKSQRNKRNELRASALEKPNHESGSCRTNCDLLAVSVPVYSWLGSNVIMPGAALLGVFGLRAASTKMNSAGAAAQVKAVLDPGALFTLIMLRLKRVPE